MDRRTPNQIALANVAKAQNAAGVQVIAKPSTPRSELTYGDLLDAGGVLGVSPALFLAGVPSANA